MNKYINMLFTVLLLTTPLLAQQAKSSSIKHLMEKTGAKNLGVQMMQQMLPALKQLAPSAPDIFWKKTMLKIDMDKMIDLIVPIYQKHLSEEDIQATIKFYSTPAGKNFIKVTPVIMQEAMVIGQQWGQNIARDIINDLKKEGYTK